MTDTVSFLLAEQQRCHDTRRVPVRVVGFASVVACLVALLCRLCARSSKNFKFPDNTFIIGLSFLLISHMSMLTGTFVGDAFLKADTRSHRATCQAQAVSTHWSLVALMLNAIYVVIVLYLLVVRRVSLSKIVARTKSYYVFVFGTPTLAVVACAALGDGYSPSEDDDLCWIRAGRDRFLWHLSFMALGVLVCVLVTPPLLLALFRAYRAVDEPSRARIFRTMLVRLMFVSLYVVLLFGVSLVTSLNQAILEGSSEGSRAARYVLSTLYSYCMVRSFVVASMGLTVATILSVKKRHVRKLLALVRLTARDDATAHCQLGGPRQTRPSRIDLATPNGSTGTDGGRLLCPSAADTGGATAVSIPPEPQHHRAHLVAAQAYTSYVLEQARELLVAQDRFSTDDSSSLSRPTLESAHSGSSFLSHTSYVSANTPRRRKSGSLVLDGELVTEL